jgi:DNA polymerase-3 subunit epsilon
MDWLVQLPRRVQVALLTAYVVAGLAVLALLLWSALTPAQREALGAAVRDQAIAVALGTALVLAGLAVLLARLLAAYALTARRLAADTRLVLGANPAHRLDPFGPPELTDLAETVNRLAERLSAAEGEVTRQVDAAKAGVEQERNLLAALMAELTVAVLVCNAEGRILLFNGAARTLLGDDPALGLGRPLSRVIEPGLIAHALDRIRDAGTSAHLATALRGEQFLQVHIAPVRSGAPVRSAVRSAESGAHGPDRSITGFVMVLDDLTARLRAAGRHAALLRELTEGTRASLGSIRAAIETVVDYPDMEAEQRRQFVEIVREESERLGEALQAWADQSGDYSGAEWPRLDMQGHDLLAVLAREVERGTAASVSVETAGDELWVKVDSHDLARCAVHLVTRLHEEAGVDRVVLSLRRPMGRTGGHALLTTHWAGRAPEPDAFRTWLSEPLTGATAASVRDVVEQHGGEVWCGEDPAEQAYVRLLLPVTATRPAPAPGSEPPVSVSGPAEFYDFALFDLHEAAEDWQDRGLGEIAYTVFDTETTGLDPVGGDEIVSIAAVHVVNRRLLRQESFERLVDPRRPVSAQSVAVHGLTSAMLEGQPTIEEALPDFARFAEDTVLVGHNVGFDLQFLRRKEERTGVRFTQPVLDTLLLDAAVHPDHEERSLEAIAARLGVPVVGRHTAIGDAMVTGQVFLALLAVLEERGLRTLGEAMAAARATYHARLDRSLYGR